jgi:hypothetical protein
MFSDIKRMNLEIEIANPVSDEEIQSFENELSIKFGSEFKAFLREFGCLSVEHLEFYGICGNNKSVPSAIFRTKEERKNMLMFPNNLVVIFEDGGENTYCIDSNDQIYLCRNSHCDKIGMKFSEFLLSMLYELNNHTL